MIGILGGSFDPVHTAHLAMADAFATALSLDEVRFLPASRPWQKHGLSASGEARAAMLVAALADHRPAHGRYVVDLRELERGGETYTVDTLADLRRELGPSMPIVFLFGADQLVHLDTWRAWEQLWDYAHLAAVTRPGFDVGALPATVARSWTARAGDASAMRAAPAGRSFLLEGLSLDVSATDIRAALATHATSSAPLERLVPAPVLDYIRVNHLYRS
jgi:nicotinate-nucleotide adenylyltransferase